MPRRAKPRCEREEYVNVTVTTCRSGPYELAVAGVEGGPWEWTLVEDDEIIAEGEEKTQEAAMRAVERMADDAREIAAGNWFPRGTLN